MDCPLIFLDLYVLDNVWRTTSYIRFSRGGMVLE